MSIANFNNTTPAAPGGNTNITWQQSGSDISGYVADATSPLTTKGDIFGFDTAGDRIPVGSDGEVLTADSGAALGVSWQAGGGSGALTLLESHTGNNTASSLTFDSSISSTYDTYQIEIVNLLPVTNNDDFVLEVSSDGGSTWDQTSGHYSWTQERASLSGGAQVTGSTSAVNIGLSGGLSVVGNTASLGGMSATLKMFGPQSGSYTPVQGQLSYVPTSLGYFIVWVMAGGYMQATAINAFRIRTVSGGNIASGTVRVYGLSL